MHYLNRYLLSLMLPLLVVSLPAAGHHSTAMFDSENPIELEGVVVDWQFTNPHSFIMLEVTDENGDTEVWELEGMNALTLRRDGWSPMSFQPGDEIIVTVRPLHSGASGGNYRNPRWAEDGTEVDPRAPRPE